MLGLSQSLSDPQSTNIRCAYVLADATGPATALQMVASRVPPAPPPPPPLPAGKLVAKCFRGQMCAGVSRTHRSAIPTLLVAPHIAVAPTPASRGGTGTEATNQGAASSMRRMYRRSLPWR